MAKIHYDELTVGVPSKASSVNYENADGTKESVQSKISKIENDVGKSKQDIEGSQGRNLIPYPYSNISATANGLTREVLADGSIHIYGTATATTNTVVHGIGDRTPIANGTYTLSGCPKGGSNTTYRAFLNGNKDGVKVVTNLALDSGDGATFTIDDTMNEYSLAITVYNGTTVDLIYKPMLEEGTVAHAYEPTTESNVTLKQNIADLQSIVNTEIKIATFSGTTTADYGLLGLGKTRDEITVISLSAYNKTNCAPFLSSSGEWMVQTGGSKNAQISGWYYYLEKPLP